MPRDYDSKLVEKAVKAIQMLSVDAVEKAAAGHPGAPMGLASIAFEIWTRHLRYDPSDPKWSDRDRFVLSAGHASMLLYSMRTSRVRLAARRAQTLSSIRPKTPDGRFS
jgi:transketolase